MDACGLDAVALTPDGIIDNDNRKIEAGTAENEDAISTSTSLFLGHIFLSAKHVERNQYCCCSS